MILTSPSPRDPQLYGSKKKKTDRSKKLLHVLHKLVYAKEKLIIM